MPRAFALPNFSALRLSISKIVLTSSEGVVVSSSLEAGWRRGMVSPSAGPYPEASTVKGGRL